MAHYRDLFIADVHLDIECFNGIILQELDPYLQNFSSNVREVTETIYVRIYPELRDALDTSKIEKIFDTGQAWSFLKDGPDNYIAINSRGKTSELLCVAEFDDGARDFNIYRNDCKLKLSSDLMDIPNPFSYPVDRLLTVFALARMGGAMFHAAGAGINGRGCVFLGRSGAGKTTLSRLLAARGDAMVLSDERIIVRKIAEDFVVFGTPWPGDAGIAVNKEVKLSRIFLLKHSAENRVREIKMSEALNVFLPAVSIPWFDKVVTDKILGFCEDMASRTPLYELHFSPNSEAVDFIEDVING